MCLNLAPSFKSLLDLVDTLNIYKHHEPWFMSINSRCRQHTLCFDCKLSLRQWYTIDERNDMTKWDSNEKCYVDE